MDNFFSELSVQRISEIEAMLPKEPSGFGKPSRDRKFWDSSVVRRKFGNLTGFASQLLTQSLPAWDNDLYSEYSRTGRRPPAEKMMTDRHRWLYPLVLAECIENRERFAPLINSIRLQYSVEPTWVLPAHEKMCPVDLYSSTISSNLAEALYLLEDKIDVAVRQTVVDAIEKRIFYPVKQSLGSDKFKVNGQTDNWWLGSLADPVMGNWNAVCLAGVVNAAVAILADRHERAVFVATGEHYSRYYINSFREDGYYDEGVGYWNYGFDRFRVLRESLLQATSGGIDIFANPQVRATALYGARMRIADSSVPCFADCRIGTKVDAHLMAYCSDVFHFGTHEEDGGTVEFNSLTSPPNLDSALMGSTPCATAGDSIGDKTDGMNMLRSFFDKSGVLICRPAPCSPSRLGVAIKGGGNNSHSHNDIGSFDIAYDGKVLLGDPGGPFAYDNNTFGPGRYNFKCLNSFGHPVPVVAGRLQLDATTVTPRVISTLFSDERDEFALDMSQAYDVPDLTKLTRTLHYFRKDEGFIVIEDDVVFSSPQSFEVALPVRCDFTINADKSMEFVTGGRKIRITLDTPDGFELTQESVQELDAPVFNRLGFKLSKPITHATVKMAFAPLT